MYSFYLDITKIANYAIVRYGQNYSFCSNPTNKKSNRFVSHITPKVIKTTKKQLKYINIQNIPFLSLIIEVIIEPKSHLICIKYEPVII